MLGIKALAPASIKHSVHFLQTDKNYGTVVKFLQ